jgi:invasion protein IalB
VRVFADKETHYAWPYQFCDAAGCQAIAPLDAAAVAKFKGAEGLQVQFFTYGKKTPDSFKFPMAGFQDALAKLIAEAEKK